MNDDELAVMIVMMGLMFAYILRLKWVIRRMKREKVAQAAQVQVALPAQVAHAATPDPEIARLKERIHVLERIAVDKENSLARAIDDLRDR